MHRVQSRTYVGQPGETVTVTTTLHGGGQVVLTIGDQPVAGNQVQLPNTPGAVVRLQLALSGPQGASCVVAISVVDGGVDGDFLLCSTFDPLPVHLYDVAVAQAAAVASFAAVSRSAPPPPQRRKAAKTVRRARSGGRR